MIVGFNVDRLESSFVVWVQEDLNSSGLKATSPKS